MSADTIYYTVYKTTCLINNKEYIGVHITRNLNDWYYGSGKALVRALKKYGKENFKKEILFVCDTPEEMFAKERELVNEDYIKRDDVYNLILGGIGSHTSIRAGQDSFMYGRKHSEETKQKLREAAKYNRTEEYRKRLSISKQNISEETRKKLSEANSGRKHSEESRKNMKDAAKKRMESPETREKLRQANLGKKASEETKQKISDAQKDRVYAPLSDEMKARISNTVRNLPKYECPHCKRHFQISHLKQYHLDRCKMKSVEEGES